MSYLLECMSDINIISCMSSGYLFILLPLPLLVVHIFLTFLSSSSSCLHSLQSCPSVIWPMDELCMNETDTPNDSPALKENRKQASPGEYDSSSEGSDFLDFDSEISGIHDSQSKISQSAVKGAINQNSTSCRSEVSYSDRPSINLWAKSVYSENSRTASEIGQPHRDISTKIRPKPPFFVPYTSADANKFFSGGGAVDETPLYGVSQPFRPNTIARGSAGGSVGGGGVVKYRSCSAFQDCSNQVVTASVGTDYTVQHIAVDKGPPSTGHFERLFQDSEKSKNARQIDCGEEFKDYSSPDRDYCCPSSTTSVNQQCPYQIIEAPMTPLQLYSSMPDIHSSGFQCPFSLMVESNHTLLNLLSPHQTSKELPLDSYNSPSVPSVPIVKAETAGSDNWDVSEAVMARCLTFLANESFSAIPIEGVETTFAPHSYPTPNTNTNTNNMITGECDKLSEFTWKLLRNFHVDMNSVLHVYEVLLSTFGPLRANTQTPRITQPSHFINSAQHSNCSFEDNNDIHRNRSVNNKYNRTTQSCFQLQPSHLTFEALCNLEEYLAGVLVLFVKVNIQIML